MCCPGFPGCLCFGCQCFRSQTRPAADHRCGRPPGRERRARSFSHQPLPPTSRAERGGASPPLGSCRGPPVRNGGPARSASRPADPRRFRPEEVFRGSREDRSGAMDRQGLVLQRVEPYRRWRTGRPGHLRPSFPALRDQGPRHQPRQRAQRRSHRDRSRALCSRAHRRRFARRRRRARHDPFRGGAGPRPGHRHGSAPARRIGSAGRDLGIPLLERAKTPPPPRLPPPP